MPRRAHRELHRLAPLHLDRLVHRVQRGPPVGGLDAVRVRGVHALDVQVLHVGAGVREAPGEVLVLAEHE